MNDSVVKTSSKELVEKRQTNAQTGIQTIEKTEIQRWVTLLKKYQIAKLVA